MHKNNYKWQLNDYTTYQIYKDDNSILTRKYYSFSNTYCQNINDKNNINNCLYAISLQKILPRYTVNNIYYRNFKIKAPDAFIIKAK